ncbi:ribonuclease P protein subunit p38 [Spea bombifrons]|uniref:ribonuclease P protein subunit p38 n=1 Tax=Spea bombifrons TaxID=233779 RepID=UPI00234BA75A|nr:ribonuclease P protein subunit p38 [Spea bombifrons]XP_053322484.1 ribonuclease P protein subunit p38 [Spea bombifrons]
MAEKASKAPGRKPKPIVAKTSLNSPYEKTWKMVVGDDMQFILQTLKDKFNQLGLKKIEPQSRPRKRKNAKKVKGCDKDTEEDTKKESCEAAGDKGSEEATAEKPGWTSADIRKQLAIGVNEVTRALEKNELILVLVCKSAKPEMITKHLIDLSASRAVPACQVPRLSENIGSALGLKSVLSLGFRKDSVFVEEVKAIIPRMPSLVVSWLESHPQKEAETTDAAPAEKQDVQTKGEAKEAVKQTGKKRKIEKETEESSNVTLQGLKVKKIVPNPNKKRKNKKKAASKK